MLLIISILIPIVNLFTLSITIPRYSVVYTFTNEHINEVYFDHQEKIYLTNINNIDDFSSIKSNNSSTTFIFRDNINYRTSNEIKHPHTKTTDHKNRWIRPKKNRYRINTLKRTYITNNRISLTTNKNGTIISGLWYDHFTATYITNVKDIQVDHIVPFKEACRSQKNTWSEQQILEFYNSPLESALLPIYKTENLKKGNLSPLYYVPPNNKFQNIYKDMWIHTKKYYDLQFVNNF